jgi:hypothetical protein
VVYYVSTKVCKVIIITDYVPVTLVTNNPAETHNDGRFKVNTASVVLLVVYLTGV